MPVQCSPSSMQSSVTPPPEMVISPPDLRPLALEEVPFGRKILLSVEPAGEAESLHIAPGIGGAAAGDRRNAAGQQREVGAGLNAVALGGDV